MKRYEHFCSLDGGGMGEATEVEDGGWVRYQDALSAVAAERERCAAVLRARIEKIAEREILGPNV